MRKARTSTKHTKSRRPQRRNPFFVCFASSWSLCFALVIVLLSCFPYESSAAPLEPIRVSDDGKTFVGATTGKRFIVWGVNYDHDGPGRLLDEYWDDEWQRVVEDFGEIKALGANVVRVHLQIGKFMDGPDRPNTTALDRLAKLVKLAEDTGVYLDVTGLGCYHKRNIPKWFDALDEQDRWSAQAAFWEAVAKTCKDSPAIFCYDLINEPILPGKEPTTEWLGGELGGKFFVQRLALELKDRTREDIAEAWVNKMVDAVRRHDAKHMITVGVIPWVFVFGGGKPLFYGERVGKRLDFVAVHFYPKKGEVDKAIKAIKAYEVGKPIVVEETFPLQCGEDQLVDFISRSADHVDGWVSFYWGTSIEEMKAKKNPSFGEAMLASWLTKFREMADGVKAGE
ncbi:MAG: cellulase family glycosylhydrolase [Phycisphaera sp.]|nr:cellulase family glycosylhydrolase [Phycisphaera sp.]